MVQRKAVPLARESSQERSKELKRMANPKGKVTIVGAGPGDPGLISLRGFEALKQAEVVFYDYLVNPIILRQAGLLAKAPHEVSLVCLGKHGQGRLLTQPEINRQLVAAALTGKRVVRLKGGDPAIFGRTAEEIMALEEAEISYEVIPGVTAALAASSAAGIPLTDRRWASAVAFVTGHECDGKQDGLDIASLARFPGTLVFYMGVTSAPTWSQELIAHGRAADTPVAIIRRCGLPGQETLHTSLAEVSQVLAPGNMRPPATIIVGEVSALQADLNFHCAGQLSGRTVLVTRPERQSVEMVSELGRLGATAMLQPAIEISSPEDWAAVDQQIQNVSNFDWLVFSSANGVTYFLDRLLESGIDLRALGGCKLAAIGPATTRALAEYHLHADLEPEEYRAEALAEALTQADQPGRCLLLRASRGREVLAEMLTSSGWEVEQTVVYQSTDCQVADADVLKALREGSLDWVTVTSSAIARSLVHLFGDDLKQSRLAAISPLTAGVLREAGHEPTVVASEYTTAGLIAAILEAENA